MAILFTHSKNSVPCYRSLNLLAHAQMEELNIGSQCGGHGICGKDRIKVKSNEPLSPITQIELKHLSKEEIEAGYRLGCQAFPSSDHQEIQITPDYI